jgi:methionyl aminopeptidase
MDFDTALLEELGAFTRQLRKEVSKLVVNGASALSIIEYIEQAMEKQGYFPAFPATISVNDVAAHFTVFDEDLILKKGDVVKVDFGVSKNGMITDNAFTIEIDTHKYDQLLLANKEALDAIMAEVNRGKSMHELGLIVWQTAQKYGFETIHNLSGHQVGYNKLHCGLSVPNYGNGDMKRVEENMELAIEPFLTLGSPKVKAGGNSNILHLLRVKPVRDPIAKKVLDVIKAKYPVLPFSKRWLLKDFEKQKVAYAVQILKKEGVLFEYEKLVTVDAAIVAQFEDTVVFAKNKKMIITRGKEQ